MSKMLMLCGGIVGLAVTMSCGAGGAILAKNMKSADTEYVEEKLQETPTVESKEKLNGWHSDGTSWFYYKDDKKQNGWVQDNNKWYYFSNDGKMKTGWVKDEEEWYYLNSDGVMVVNINPDGFYLNEQEIIQEKLSQRSNLLNNGLKNNVLNNDNTEGNETNYYDLNNSNLEDDGLKDDNFLNDDGYNNSANIMKETAQRGTFVQDSAEAKSIIYSNDPGNYQLFYKGILSSAEINSELEKYYENFQLNESVHLFYIYDENNADVNCIYYVGKSTGTLYRRNGGYHVLDDVYMIKNSEIVNVYNIKQNIS